jgi:hypothetical protein
MTLTQRICPSFSYLFSHTVSWTVREEERKVSSLPAADSLRIDQTLEILSLPVTLPHSGGREEEIRTWTGFL